MELYQKGSQNYLQVLVQDEDGIPVHSAMVTASLHRNSDNHYLDGITNTFVSSGGNLNLSFSELGASGLYRFLFDQSWDVSGVNQTYTVIYSIASPFVAITYDTLSFFDLSLDDIKGVGWSLALHKPDLMSMANKTNAHAFDPVAHSLEALSDIRENYNTEGV